jgi:uncharacterized protein YdhG (YjbR/CyaY superfamily)
LIWVTDMQWQFMQHSRARKSNPNANTMAKTSKFKTVEEYIKAQPLETKNALLALRKIIKKAAPKAIELINYDIPAFALVEEGKRDKQIMIAGYKNFVGFYTGTNILEHFSSLLSDYTVGKASVQFPNNKPLPEKLIIEIVWYKQKQIL